MQAKEVTTAQLFTASGQPHPEGLLSPIIFGSTPDEKRVMTGYIKLPMYFIHPEVYKGFFKRRFRDIDNIINGTKRFSISPDGELIPNEKGGTGLKWFYDNFDKINVKGSDELETDKIMSKELKKAFNRMAREDVFFNKVTVCELILRDINTGDGNRTKVDELNTIYQGIIQLAQVYSYDNNNMAINRDSIAMKLQLKLVALLEYAFDKIFGKDGIQRKKTMGRNVDYTSRNIISAVKFKGKFGSSPLNMDNAGYPLSAVIGSFTPMFMYNMNVFFKKMYDTGKIKVSPDEFESFYDLKYCKSLIDKYLRSWSERLDKIPSNADNDNTSFLELTFNIVGEDGSTSVINRQITLIELFYMIAYMTVELTGRVTSITRYPILNKHNNVLTKIHVLSTTDTKMVVVDGIEYPYYPDIFTIEKELKTKDPDKYEEIIGALFQETIKMSNVYLPGFNADFDRTLSLSIVI